MEYTTNFTTTNTVDDDGSSSKNAVMDAEETQLLLAPGLNKTQYLAMTIVGIISAIISLISSGIIIMIAYRKLKEEKPAGGRRPRQRQQSQQG